MSSQSRPPVEKRFEVSVRPSAFVAGFDCVSGMHTFAFDRPQLAFVGRSNVGKSSLINAILGRRRLAITSKTPGRTRQVNIFSWGHQVHLIDLPGYGYAVVSKAQQKTWDALMEAFFKTQSPYRLVYVLIDGRHGLKDSDRYMIAFLKALGVDFQIVLTKTDKVSKAFLDTYDESVIGPFEMTSSKTGRGISLFREKLYALENVV